MIRTDLVRRTLRLQKATGSVRLETFMGREHLVVPVIGFVEGVIWPVNSEFPELLLADELAIAPWGWNGRPVFEDHPQINGEYVSGNSPDVLESGSFGLLFNVNQPEDILSTRKLRFEAWLDAERMVEIGHETMLERVKKEEEIEISTGIFALVESAEGEYMGKKYKGIWRNIMPDHLALLPEGVEGACSIDMGCGAPRVSRASITHILTETGIERVEGEDMPQRVSAAPPAQPAAPAAATTGVAEASRTGALNRMRTLLSNLFRTNQQGMSDSDLRRTLYDALRSVEPGFIDVYEVFPDDGTVVYACMPDDTWNLYIKKFTKAADGSVTLAAEKQLVEPVTRYEPVGAVTAAASSSEVVPPVASTTTTQPPPATQQPCGCGAQGVNAVNRAQIVQALIDNTKTPYTAEDRTWLEAVPEARLTAMQAHAEQAPPAAAPAAPATAVVQPPAAPQTVEAFVSSAPSEVQEVLNEGLRASRERRTSIVTQLKASGRCDFSDDDLAKMPMVGLERLLKLTGSPTVQPTADFSGLGVATLSTQQNSNEEIPPAPNMADRIKAARSGSQPQRAAGTTH